MERVLGSREEADEALITRSEYYRLSLELVDRGDKFEVEARSLVSGIHEDCTVE